MIFGTIFKIMVAAITTIVTFILSFSKSVNDGESESSGIKMSTYDNESNIREK